MPPDVAVIIPTYDRLTTLPRAIGSALEQEGAQVEVVVVDDGSADKTEEFVRCYPERRVSYFRFADNAGANRARNKGVTLSSAPLIAFLDSDDEFCSGRLARLIAFFQTHPDVDVLIDAYWTEHRGRSSLSAKYAEGVVRGELLERLLVAHALPLTASCVTIRRQTFEEIGGFDEALLRHQDRDFLLRLARKHRVALGNGADVIKHQSADSLSRDSVTYLEGLSHIVARHPVFHSRQNRNLLAYLTARGVFKLISTGNTPELTRFWKAHRHLRNLPSLTRCMPRFLLGKAERKALTRSLRTGSG